MSRMQSPLDRLGSELEAAAGRQIAAHHATAPGAGRIPARRRRWWARHTLVVILVLGIGSAGAGAVAATLLLRHGQPVPLRGGRPVTGRSNGAPTAGSIRFLTTTVADPGGGTPWAMRYWTTDRGYACFQVGRYDQGHVGIISGSGASQAFHPFQVGTSKDGVSGCYPVDGAGHARIALHQVADSGGETDGVCQDGIQTQNAAGRIVPARFPPGCHRPARTIDVGLLGPAARQLTVSVGGKDRTLTPIGPEGAYLVVQPYVKPVYRTMGFHHTDANFNDKGIAETWLALTPAAHTIRQVVYDDGTCHVRPTYQEQGACLGHAAWVTLPPVKQGDVRAPVRARVVDDKHISVSFTARQAVTDRRSGYSVALKPKDFHRGFIVYDYDHDIAAGQTAHMLIGRNGYPAGRFTIRVQFRTAPSSPSLSQIPWQQGPLVGVAHVTLR